MIGDSSVLAVIPARGGSKGLPGKNIRDLGGKPLLAWSIEVAKQSRYIDRTILSSDDEAIIAVGREWGCEVPFVRPAALATDDADTMAVVRHALDAVGEGYDYVVLLQPTTPLRRVADIDACIELCVERGVTAAVSLVEADKSPYWMFRLDDTGRMSPVMPQAAVPDQRQDTPPVFALNGAVYVATCAHVKAGGDFFPPDAVAWVMPASRSVDIDTEFDFNLVELMLKSDER